MKKRVVTVFLTGLLAASMLLGGCTSKSEKKALEYKELGIKQLQQEDYDGAVDSFQKALDQSLGRITANELDVCYYKALAYIFKHCKLTAEPGVDKVYLGRPWRPYAYGHIADPQPDDVLLRVCYFKSIDLLRYVREQVASR